MAIRGGRGGGPGGGGRSHFSSSSGSSGRSHFSSSSRSSSRSHIGSSRMSHHHHSHHRGGIGIGFHFHGESMSLPGFLIGLSIFLVFITIILGIGIGTTNSSLKTIEHSYNNYQSLIEMAMEDEDYVRYATVTGKYQGKGDRWYIEYVIDEGPGYIYDSFAIYSKEEVSQYKTDQEIKVAVEDKVIDAYTATIPFDYYNSPIKNDGEYIEINRTKTILICIAIGTATIATLLLVVAIKKIKSSKEETSSDILPEPTSTTKTCNYCGGKIPAGQDKCPQCGAKLID